MNTISEQIEQLLLDRRDWVSTEEIVTRFGLPDDRPLRQVGDHPGLCSKFAISQTGKGFKHVRIASTTEWIRFKKSQRGHCIRGLRRVRDLDRARHNATSSYHHHAFEKDTGQGVLAICEEAQ